MIVKNFLEIFRRSRKEEFDFLYCSVQDLECRRNHEDLIWSKKEGFLQPYSNEVKSEDIDNGNQENIRLEKE